MAIVVMGVAVVLLLAAGVALFVTGRTKAGTGPFGPRAGASSRTTLASGPVGSRTTASTPTSAEAEASGVGLQASDLPNGFTQQLAGSSLSKPSAPSRCSPLSSEHWLADVSSPQYAQATGGLYVYSTVVIMRSPKDARQALFAIRDPSYGTRCYKPAFDQQYTQATAAANQQTTCGLSLSGSTISAIPSTTLPGITGWEWVGQLHCDATGANQTVVQTVLNEIVGPIYVQAWFRELGGAPTANLERQVMSAMVARARALKKRG